jgi:Domain of unknown function (DUF6285)
MTQDRPDAPELLDAVAEFLFADVREWAPPDKRFVTLVAANVCAVVARELRAGEDPSRADVALFNEMLGAEPGEPADPDVERAARDAARDLARRIREGDFDTEMEETAARLREHVRRKLVIARPGYSGAGPDS